MPLAPSGDDISEAQPAEVAPVSAKPPKVRKERFSIGRTIKPEDIMAFSRQLSSFLEAGISVVDALEIVATQSGSTAMRKVVIEIRDSIYRGTSFASAVDAHPEVFPAFYRAMLESAEYTGNLDSVLSQLSAYLERDIAAKRQVKSALTYPVIVLVVAFAAMIVMSVFVLPKFTGLYRSLGATLPLPTRMLMGFTDFMASYWLRLIGAAVLVLLVSLAVIGGDRGKRRRDVLAMRLPLIGNLFHLISLERFCRVLASLSSAGVPLPIAIGLSADSTNNSIFQSQMLAVREALVRGGGLYEPMVETGLFPIAARQMIQVGERTGMLGDQLGKAAAYYEREVAFTMKKATELFQPAVILFVALIVGFVAVAQVAAMYSIFGQIK
ncbi:MAG: type pilus assembly protein PilC [Ilumatobacteraceae bacterium]|jgi:type IV pilus assembly protein PilC